jgi:hypothetical protein
MLVVHYQKKNPSGKTVRRSAQIVGGWTDYSSLDSALLRPKSANSPSEAMPPPASEE